MAGGRGVTAQAPSNGQQALQTQSQQQGQEPQAAIKAASSVTQAQQQQQRQPVGRPVQKPRVSVPQSHWAGQGSASNKAGTASGPVPQLLLQQQQQQAGARSAGSSGGGRGILPRPAPAAGLQASQLQGGQRNQRVGLERYATPSPRVAALQPQSASQQGSWYSPAGAGQLAAGSMPMQGGFAAGSMPMQQQQRAAMGLQAASSGPVQSGYVAAFNPPQQQPHTPGLSAPASQVFVGGEGGYAMNPQLQQQLPAGQGFQQQAGVQGFVMDGFQGLSQVSLQLTAGGMSWSVQPVSSPIPLQGQWGRTVSLHSDCLLCLLCVGLLMDVAACMLCKAHRPFLRQADTFRCTAVGHVCTSQNISLSSTQLQHSCKPHSSWYWGCLPSLSSCRSS